MSDTPNKFYLTTPIYYVNARPHIGHAYTTIAADVIARRHRLLGDDTFFLTGTDEHGQKIQRSAEAAGIPPQQFADEVSASFQNLWKRMGITNNKFIRTTDEAHKKGVQKLFTQLQKNGFIELRSYTGQYCISDETFVDVPVGAPCPECGRITETVTEENYFFKLSQFQSQLIDLIESDTLAIQPDSRKNEVLSFLRGNVSSSEESRVPHLRDGLIVAKVGEAPQTSPDNKIAHSANGTPYVTGALKDLSISRTSVKWGIPVPGDEKHVIYVWLDALSNYMTAIGYGAEDRADLTEEQKKQEQAKFKKYWPADLHLVGKEIIRFHCVYWPAFLLALNPKLAGKTPNDLPFEDHLNWAKDWLPKAITAHGWLLFEESKMSKSRGNIVRTETILDAFGTLLPNPNDPAGTGGSKEDTANRTSGGSTGLQPGESDTQETGASAPDLPSTEANSPVKGTASAVPQQTTGSAALATEARLSSKYAPAPSDTTNRTSGGSIGLQPGESDTQETGASAPDLLSTDKAWKQEQDLFAADVLRYFLLREIPFGQDGSFSFDALVQRYNSDLANGYGNLVSRTLSMIEKYFDGQIPFGKMDEHVGFDVQLCAAAIWNNYIEQDFSSLLINISTIIRAADQYITSTVPWKVAADESRTDELKNILYTAVESIRIVTALIEPVLPYTAARVFSQLGIPVERAPGSDAKWTASKLGPLSPIFPRAPKELIQLMNDMEQNPSHQKSSPAVGLPHITNNADASTPPRSEFVESPISSASASPAQNHIAESTHALTAHHPAPQAPESTPQIAIDDFIKIDLRVAQIVVAERIPKADKLLRLEVDLGYERRQILSGIAQWYTPEELIGRRIVVIANLAPRKMRGLESHGMLLAASHGEDGKPVLATFAEDIPLGSRLK